jgi:hypothetical protein
MPGHPDNIRGTVRVAGFMMGVLLTGDVTVATLDISARGAAGISTSIEVTIIDLGDRDGKTIPATPVSAPVQIVGVVEVEHTLTMAVVGEGTTAPAVGKHTYAANTVGPITATPAAGWKFSHWVGDVADTTDPTTTVTMDADKSITAHFTIIPDVIPLEVIIVLPEDGATDVTVGTDISVTFSEAVDKAAVEEAFSIEPEVPGAFTWVNETLTFDPDADLTRGITYTITISTAARDLAGNPLVAPHTWSFTTEPDFITEPEPFPWGVVWLIIGIPILGVLIYFLVIRRRREVVQEQSEEDSSE